MKDVKTRASQNTPRILSATARAPKELARKSIMEAKEKAEDVAERQQPQDESPEQYAENRIGQAAEETVHRAGDEVSYQSRQAIEKIKDAKRNKDRFQQSDTTTHTENGSTVQNDRTANTPNAPNNQTNAYRAGRERVVRNAQASRQTARSTRYTARSAQQTAQTAERTATATKNAVKTSARTTVKTSHQGVKVAKHTYAITDITIYESASDWTLPATDGKTLVLVTCYPFQYSGHAPGKCVVRASLV